MRVLILLAPALMLAVEGLPDPVRTNATSRSLPLMIEDLSTVSSARLYVTEDDGATWRLEQDMPVVAGDPSPRFTFKPQHDGVYGFASAVAFKDGHREPEPREGEAPGLRLLVDTTSPTFAAFSAAWVDGGSTVRATWQASDLDLAERMVNLELSSDQGATFAPLATGREAQGEMRVPLQLPGDWTEVQIRAVASDRSGNRGTSTTVILPLTAAAAAPVAPGDTHDLTAALAALPAPAAETPMAEVAPAPSATPTAPRPEIVVPTAAAAPTMPAPVAHVDTVNGPGLAAAADRDTLAETPSWQRHGRSTVSLTPAEPPMVVTGPVPKPAQGPVAKPTQAAPLAGYPAVGRLSPAQAQHLLAEARAAGHSGDLAGASARYRRLHDSSLAETAILEEAALMRASGRPTAGAAVCARVPENGRSDAITIEHSRCLLAARQPADALQVLSRINRESPRADEALFLSAVALRDQGRINDAKKVFAFIARGSGAFATQARSELDHR